MRPKKCALIAWVLPVLLCIHACAAYAQQGISQPTEFGAEPKLNFPEIELSRRMTENAKKSLALNTEFVLRINQLLAAADTFDVETYRKNDDALSDVLEQLEANYLEYQMLLEASPPEVRNLPETKNFLATIKPSLQRTRLSTYKSSAIFYLCFGQPVQSSHYAKLALAIAEQDPSLSTEVAELLFYSGAASYWSGDYTAAEDQLKRAIALEPKQRFAAIYLGQVYIAQGQLSKSIELLRAKLTDTDSDEVKGNINRTLAIAYTLAGQQILARQAIDLAKKQLDKEGVKEFKGVGKESLGIVCALAGKFDIAERQLSDALPVLQLSPLNLGNRLEAGQAALWRSYCREKLGDKVGAAEDRKYALGISDEASQLPRLAGLLDPIFGHKETISPVGAIRDRWAIVVGVGNFADPKVPRLRYPVKDATDVKDFLTSKAGFSPNHIRFLADSAATCGNIKDCLTKTWLPSVVRPGDLVLLFISSHGTPAYKEIGAFNSLVTYDTEIDHLFTTSLPLQELVRMIRGKLKKQHVFVVLDTCYSGGLGAPGDEAKTSSNVDPELMVISNYQLLVSSSSSQERSWESKRYPNSVFTRQLLDTLGKNPRFDDFRSLFPGLVEKVNLEVLTDFKNKQTPTLAGRWSGRGLMDAARGAGGK